jgi:Lrp/AsnC family transcriptional regulator
MVTLTHKLDRIDRKLLLAVQEDSSRSTSEIADLVGLSQAPCWRRLQKLRELGFIRKEVALLDRRALGLTVQLLVQVQLTTHGRAHVEEFTGEMARHDRVLDCFITLGSVDAVLRIVAHDIADYERFFFNVLSQAPGVREANSMVILTEAKSTTKLPVDEIVV